MKVAIDARMIKNSGIGTCIQNWMKYIDYEIALGNENDIKKYKDIKTIDFNCPIYGIKEQLKFPYKKLKQEKVDLLFIPHYNVPIFYKGTMAVTIHDLTHLVLSEFLPNKFAKCYAKFMIWIACKKASIIFVVSENTKKDLIRIFNVDSNKIIVNYNGVGNEFIKKDKKSYEYLYKKYNIPRDKKILMYVGNLKPHKNLSRLLEAVSKIDNKEDYRLVLVGKSFENQINLNDKEKELGINNIVIHTGIVEQGELVDLYNLADLFVFPSLYEGFGLPIIEAMSCGTNVIASNNSSIPEVGGVFINYFDATNSDDIKMVIEGNINKSLDSNAYNWIKQFDWKKNSNKIYSALEEVYAKKIRYKK